MNYCLFLNSPVISVVSFGLSAVICMMSAVACSVSLACTCPTTASILVTCSIASFYFPNAYASISSQSTQHLSAQIGDTQIHLQSIMSITQFIIMPHFRTHLSV